MTMPPDERSPLCRIARCETGKGAPTVPRINGQPVVFKAAAGFVAGPLLLASVAVPQNLLLRMAAGTIGVLVTIIDGGHVIRYWRKRRAEKLAALPPKPAPAPRGPSPLALLARRA